MNTLKSFVLLDFKSIKPYLTIANLLIYVAIALFITLVSGSASSGFGVGAMLGLLIIGYPFSIGEKCNLDALYITLALDRDTVVTGRYLFTFVFNACAIFACIILASAGSYIAQIINLESGGADSLGAFFLLASLFFIAQMVQLPIYFKLGYSKAKFLGIISMVAIVTLYSAVAAIVGATGFSGGAIGTFTSALNGMGVLVCTALLLVVVVIVTYRLSLRFYRKREF